MTTYLRKYVNSLASAKEYIAQWLSNHVLGNEELFISFPTLLMFDRKKHIYSVHIKARIFLILQTKSLTSYFSSLLSLLTGSKSDETNNENSLNVIEMQI
ncbi:unnamed protein product [Rotaria sp. Silwood1]|nr:unnamed protein product [Rotaria sp. Silwood1]CAF5009504.1 unnamed protein product [Rotaria sp. Silwood1]